MGKSTKMRRFLQKLAVMLAIIMAVPSINMPVDFLGSVTEVYADGKVDTGLGCWIDKTDDDKAAVNIFFGYDPGDVDGKIPTGTISLYYSLDEIQYDGTTGEPANTDNMSWIEWKTGLSLGEYTFDIPDELKSKSYMPVKASYPGDENFEAKEVYCEVDFKAPVIESISEVKKDVNEDIPYSFEITIDEIVSIVDNEADVDVQAMLTPYTENGYDNINAKDILNSDHIDLDINWNDDKATLKFDLENVESGIYVLQVVCIDRGRNISNKVVTTPFSTRGKLYTNNDIFADCEDDLVYEGTSFVPDINVSVLDQEDEERKKEVAVWLRVIRGSDTLEYTFLQTSDEYGNAVEAVSGDAITAAGEYNIYMSSKDEEVELFPGVYGTLNVKFPIDVDVTTTDLTYTGVEQTPSVTLTVECDDANKKASLQNYLDSMIKEGNVFCTFRQIKDGNGNTILKALTSTTVKDAGTYFIYVNTLDDRISLPSGNVGTLMVKRSNDIPVVSGSAILVSVSEDKKQYVISVDTSCIINANDGDLEYCFDGKKFTKENSYKVDANKKVKVQIRFADSKNTEASEEVYEFPEITTPTASLMPDISLAINNGKRFAVITPKSSLGKDGDISQIEVYCTTDGKNPTIDVPDWGLGVYSFAISDEKVTVKAVAVEPGRIMSEVAQKEFTQDEKANTDINTVTGLKVIYKNAELIENETITLNLIDEKNPYISIYGVITPENALNKDIWWKVDKEGIVSLSSKRTKSDEVLSIKALKMGEVTITAYSVENPGKNQSFTVKVEPYTITDTITPGEKKTYEIANPQNMDLRVEFSGKHSGVTAKLKKSKENDGKTYLVVNTSKLDAKNAEDSYTIWIGDNNLKSLNAGNLYALAKINIKCKITYHSNIEKQIEDKIFAFTEKVVLETPVSGEYKFEGWYYDADFKTIVTSETTQNGGKVYYIPAGTKGNVDVYAKWSIKPVTIIFKPNYNGTNEEDITQEIKKNVTTKLKKNEFTRNDYDFVGWTTKEGSKKVDYLDGQEVTFDSDKTLYAVWAKEGEEFTITLKYDDGVLSEKLKDVWVESEDGTATHTYIYGNAESYPALPTEKDLKKENYTFAGWKLESGTDVKGIVGMGGDLTIVACWKGNIFEIQYDSNEKMLKNSKVNGKMKSQKVAYGETWVPLNCGFNALGYKFVGWSKSTNAKDVIAVTPSVFNEAKDLTLYAIWKAEDQYLYLYSQYGDIIAKKYNFGTLKNDGDFFTIKYTYEDIEKNKIILPTKTQMNAYRKGLEFNGWYMSKKDDYGNYSLVPKGKKIQSVKPGNTDYYVAKWKYSIKIVYHFEDKKKEKKISFNGDKKFKLIKNPFKKVTGCYFKGWAIEEDGEVIFKNKQKITIDGLNEAFGKLPKNLTYHLYAVFVPKQKNYNLTIVDEDGKILGEESFIYKKGISNKKLKKIGKKLSANYSHFEDVNGKKVSCIKKKTVGDQTLVLVKKVYTSRVSLTFNNNSATVNTKVSGKVNTKKVNSTNIIVKGVKRFKASGYVLIGYSTDPNANEPDYYITPKGYMYLNASVTHDGEHIAVTYDGGTVTLYAIWKPEKTYDSYTYSFNMGLIAPDDDGMTSPDYEKLYNCKKVKEIINGEVIVSLKNFNQDNNKFVLPEPKRIGFKFTGWLEKDSEGEYVTAGITNAPARYLVATWEPMES